jgi:outer membrane protein assembly factor BamA
MVFASDRLESWVWSYAYQLKKGKTDSITFARLSQIEAGSQVVLSQVPRAERSLMRLGYFEKSGEAKLYRIQNRNRLVPVFDLRDAAANFAEASVAYDAESNVSNWRVMAQLLNIAGTARDFSLSGENSSGYRNVEMSYKEPFIFGLSGSLKARGMFSEEDSAKQRNADIAYIQKLGWEWQYSLGGGYKNDMVFSSLSLLYDNRDKIPLPFKGLKAEVSSEFSKFAAIGVCGENYQPVFGKWALLLASQGYGLLPSKDYEKEDLFSVGGLSNFKAMQPRSLRARAYGLSEMDFQWHGIESSALHIFSQIGVYRNRPPFRGWERILAYGLGWEQGISNASIAIYYALLQGAHPIDGLLNMSVRVGF